MRTVKCWIWYGPLLAAMLLSLGCPAGPHVHSSGKEPAKEEPAPHGGHVFAVPGHKFHAELVLDKAGKKATVYMLDGTLANAVPTSEASIKLSIRNGATMPIVLKADRQESDPPDMTSRFTGVDDKFGEDLNLDNVQISAVVARKPYVFTLEKD